MHVCLYTYRNYRDYKVYLGLRDIGATRENFKLTWLHMSKGCIGISHINPFTMKPNKVGISL